MLDYIKRRQKQWEEKIKRAAELEAEKEAARVVETPDTEVESESSENEEDTARKKILLEQQEQEAERLRQDSERIRSEDWAAMSEWLRDNQKQHAATIEAR